MKLFDRIFQLIGVLVIAAWMIPFQAVSIANVRNWSATSVDPSGCFLWVSIHHLTQFAFTILFMKVFFGRSLSEWGFNIHEYRLSLRLFGWFCLIYLLPVFLYNVLPHLISGKPPGFGYPLTTRNITGTLGFQFLLAGTCEEPLFRGFVMGCLAQSWKGNIRLSKFTFPISGLWATLIFMIGHMQIHWVPFSIQASFWQQVWALGLGLYYAYVFNRTGSLLAPVLAHGYADGIIFVFLYLLAAVMR